MAAETVKISIPIDVKDNTAQSLSAIMAKLDALEKRNASVGVNVDVDDTQLGHVAGRLDAEERRVRQLSVTADVIDNATGVLSNIAKAGGNLAGRTFRFTIKAIDYATAPIRGLLRGLTSLQGMIMGGAGIYGAIVKPMQMGMSYEMTEMAFSTMLGSMDKAKAFLAEVDEFAKLTPFSFNELIDSAKLLQAYGFSVEDTLPMMRIIGDTTAGLGLGGEGITRVVRALGQIRAKGKVYAQELLQLQEAGINANQILQEELGMTGEQVADIAKSKVTAQQAIDALLRGMEKRFGGLMEAQSRTASGMIEQLKDITENKFMRSWGQGLWQGAQPVLARVISFMDNNAPKVEKWSEALYNLGAQISTNLVSKAEDGIYRLGELVESESFQGATVVGKVKLVWDEFIGEPLADWFERNREKIQEKALSFGTGLGKNVGMGIRVLLGIGDEIEEGATIGYRFAQGFIEGLDIPNLLSKVWEGLKNRFADAATLLPGMRTSGSAVTSAAILAFLGWKFREPLGYLGKAGAGLFGMGKSLAGLGGSAAAGSAAAAAAAAAGTAGAAGATGAVGAAGAAGAGGAVATMIPTTIGQKIVAALTAKSGLMGAVNAIAPWALAGGAGISAISDWIEGGNTAGKHGRDQQFRAVGKGLTLGIGGLAGFLLGGPVGLGVAGLVSLLAGGAIGQAISDAQDGTTQIRKTKEAYDEAYKSYKQFSEDNATTRSVINAFRRTGYELDLTTSKVEALTEKTGTYQEVTHLPGGKSVNIPTDSYTPIEKQPAYAENEQNKANHAAARREMVAWLLEKYPDLAIYGSDDEIIKYGSDRYDFQYGQEANRTYAYGLQRQREAPMLANLIGESRGAVIANQNKEAQLNEEILAEQRQMELFIDEVKGNKFIRENAQSLSEGYRARGESVYALQWADLAEGARVREEQAARQLYERLKGYGLDTYDPEKVIKFIEENPEIMSMVNADIYTSYEGKRAAARGTTQDSYALLQEQEQNYANAYQDRQEGILAKLKANVGIGFHAEDAKTLEEALISLIPVYNTLSDEGKGVFGSVIEDIITMNEVFTEIPDGMKISADNLERIARRTSAYFSQLDSAQKGAFLDAISHVRTLDALMRALPREHRFKVDVEEKITQYSLSTFNNPKFTGIQMEAHAEGDRLSRPHLGLVAEDGPEYVIPLNPAKRQRALSLWTAAGRELGVSVMGSGGRFGGAAAAAAGLTVAVGGVTITVNAGGENKTIVETIKQHATEIASHLAGEIASGVQQAFGNMPKSAEPA